jgi:hypothetical protein
MFFSSQSSENHWQWLQFPLQWGEDKPEHLEAKCPQECSELLKRRLA